ncbi:MAG: hypothetical protein IKR85_02095 [Clostridia bacterium]|nr:hypothetical protein [Clostridia bacterium]
MKRTKIRLRRALCAFMLALCLLIPHTSAAAEDASEPYQPSRIIVSLGDSFSSGEGNEPFYGQKIEGTVIDRSLEQRLESEDWLGHRSTRSWPGRLTLPAVSGPMSQNKDTNWYFFASSGATTDHYWGTQYRPINKVRTPQDFAKSEIENMKKTLDMLKGEDIKYERMEIFINESRPITPQREALVNLANELKAQGRHVDYVTLTLGGNDVGFSDIVTKVFTPEALQDEELKKYTLTEMLDSARAHLPTLDEDLENIYKDISKILGKDTAIIVAGYPPLFAERTLEEKISRIVSEENKEATTDALLSLLLGVGGTGTKAVFEGAEVLADIITGGIHIYNALGTYTVTAQEAAEVNEAVREFNEHLKKNVESLQERGINIHYVDVYEAFDGDGKGGHAAYSDEPYLNPVELVRTYQDWEGTLTKLGSFYSVHPNEAGLAAYAECVQQKINELEARKMFKYAWDRLTANGSWYEGRAEYINYSDFGTIDIIQADVCDSRVTGYDPKHPETAYAAASGRRYDDVAGRDWQSYERTRGDGKSSWPVFFIDTGIVEGVTSYNYTYDAADMQIELEKNSFTVHLSTEQLLKLDMSVYQILERWQEDTEYSDGEHSLAEIYDNPYMLFDGSYSSDEYLSDIWDYILYGNGMSGLRSGSMTDLELKGVDMEVGFLPDMTFDYVYFITEGSVQNENGLKLDMTRQLEYIFSDSPTDAYALLGMDEDEEYYDDYDLEGLLEGFLFGLLIG